MGYHFYKMHGCGNDYIYFDCFQREIPKPEQLSIKLSDRHFGVGGDGAVLICPSNTADAKMRMFNADGSEGKMCGNAIRCVGKYLYERRNIHKDPMTVETLSGIKTLHMETKAGKVQQVTVAMGAPGLAPQDLPVLLPGDQVVNRQVQVGEETYAITCVSMGNPHCVVFVEDSPMQLPLEQIGPKFEKHPMFPQGVNTEFVRVISPHELEMRVWERGSGETWACGTGACATAVAAVLNGHCPRGEEILLHLRGGDLRICWKENQVYMTGPATFVFEGELMEE
jgi:diaminopimelate epimerase